MCNNITHIAHFWKVSPTPCDAGASNLKHLVAQDTKPNRKLKYIDIDITIFF